MFVRRAVALVLLTGAALLCFATATGAQSTGEHIENYTVDMTIARDGTLAVNETIVYDFGVVPHHGIQRDLVRRETFDAKHDRLYDLNVLSVRATAGTPADLQQSGNGSFLHLRIGDPNRTITGVHTYEIAYTVKGALLPFPDHDELNWDAIGNEWTVPIDEAIVKVHAPADIQRVACFSGPQGSRAGCEQAAVHGSEADFVQTALGSGSGMTVVVALDKGVIVPEPKPILEKRRTLGDAFDATPLTAGIASGLALVGVAGVSTLAYRHGRDRRYTGSAVDAALGNVSGDEERIPPGQEDAGPVEFVPPEQVRPGQVGTLIDEQANLLDVTATIVDLAVRGHLQITELDEGRHPDYQLTRTDGGKGELRPYEQTLHDALFSTGTSVKLSDLKYKFTAQLATVKNALYDDVVANGWYRVRPDRTRLWWRLLGIAVVALGVLLTVVTALASSFGLIPLAVLVTGIALLAAGGRMPARTGKGSAMLSRIEGFRRLFDEGEEDVRQRFAEQHGIFSEYLPYAIVFGCTKKWARAFEGLSAEELGATSWYSGPNIVNAFALSSAMDDFDTRATGTLYASQPSSSSSSGFSGGGFSGGGGGGGGGGSW
jgi:uncharacterized membrane protein YgcG